MEKWQIAVLTLSIIALLPAVYFMIRGPLIFRLAFWRMAGDRDYRNRQPESEKQTAHYKWFFAQPFEEISIRSGDGLTLRGHLLRSGAKRLAIMVHGYHGRYYSLTLQAKLFHELGYDLLLINNRAHDTSEGRYMTMGPKETEDLRLWIKKAEEINKDYSIVLFGLSLGAYYVMRTAAAGGLPKSVRCAVEDCGFFGVREELTHQARSVFHLFLPKASVRAGLLYARFFKGIRLEQDLAKSLPKAEVPLLFLHGKKDVVVPYADVERCFKAANPGRYKEMKGFSDAGHGECAARYTAEYKALLASFTDKFMK